MGWAMENIKAIALDLDGTLVGLDHHVSKANKEAVKRAATAGITIILASGRPFVSVEKIADEIELSQLNGYIIAANGGHIVKMSTGETILQRSITPELCSDVAKFVSGFEGVELYTYDTAGMLIENLDNPHAKGIAEGILVPMKQVPDLLSSLNDAVTKFIVTGEVQTLQSIFEPLKEKFANQLECEYGGGHFIELLPFGVNKAEGLRLLLRKLGLTGVNLMCCGDGENDLQMFAYAAYPVAMENASEHVKKFAKYRTDSCEADGVATLIERVLRKEI